MIPQPDLTADIERWNQETMMLLHKVANLRLGQAGYCSEPLEYVVAAAHLSIDDRRRIEAVLAAERSRP